MKTLQKRFSQSAVTQALALACAVAAFGSPAAFADDSNFTANVSIVSSNTCQPTITLPTLNAFTQTLDISTANSTASYNGYAAPTPDAGMLTKIEMSAGCTIPSLQVVLRHTSNEAKPWTHTATAGNGFMSPAGNGMIFTLAEVSAVHMLSGADDVSDDYALTNTTGYTGTVNLATSDTTQTKTANSGRVGVECRNVTPGAACTVQGYTARNWAATSGIGAGVDAFDSGTAAYSINRSATPVKAVATSATVGVAMMAGSVPRDMSGAADYFVIPNGTTIVDSYQLILSLA